MPSHRAGTRLRSTGQLQRAFSKLSGSLARIPVMTTPATDGRKRPEAQLLVVEDEPNILELLAASLRYAGFEVISPSAGTEAVQAAQRYRPDLIVLEPDLIVLDVMLLDMDGFYVVRRLRGGGD